MNDRQLITSSLKGKILKELSGYKEKITVNRYYIGNINVNEALRDLLDDTPWLFFVDEWTWEETGQKINIFPKYKYTRKRTEELRERCQKEVGIILSRLKEDKGVNGIAKHLHDILIRNIKYEKQNDYEVHTIIGPLLKRKCVCDGFSKLYKLILDELGIENYLIYGKGFVHTLSDSEEHAWNLVKIDNDFYHVDVTYDATLSMHDYIRYDYFLIDDTLISMDHYWNRSIIPKANNNKFFIYNQDKYVVSSRAELGQKIYERIREKCYDFVLKLPQNLDTNLIQKIVLEYTLEVMNAKRMAGEVSVNVNPTQNIIYVRIR
ncbi:hypothetical protein DXB77_07490 [Clostridium sp. OM05-9]|jgi:hypothetical protein|uniref:transglutaminase domain-containing protein n=1 Tax=Clostridium sp. OM05-9 TaxID=2293045 RepID=UPI000E4922D3|nr:transglutaminase domain-containing protein [Clostridium sp. OM05-9]RHV11023.1 hypothetical protein DXB77_07490 [Clostridium sp. OM05-9]